MKTNRTSPPLAVRLALGLAISALAACVSSSDGGGGSGGSGGSGGRAGSGGQTPGSGGSGGGAGGSGGSGRGGSGGGADASATGGSASDGAITDVTVTESGTDQGGGTGGTNGADAASTDGAPAIACDKPHAAGVITVQLMSAGRSRTFRLFVPRSYDGKTRLPLVLNLHGSGGNATAFAAETGFETLGQRDGFFVAGLAAVNGSWNVPPAAGNPDDVAYARDTIDRVASMLCVDAARVYATGFSGGGRMSSRLGCQLPDKITAIGPVAGVRWPAPCAGRPVPVIAIHGLDDPLNTYAGDGNMVWNESVEDAVKGWATKNGCNATRTEEDPPGPVSIYTWGQCQQGATVKLIRMAGQGHTYPRGTPIDTSEEAWKFLKEHAIR